MNIEALDINIEVLNNAIAGDLNALYDAFYWDMTPQRHNYWSNIYFRTTSMTDEDFAYLKQMRDEYYAQNTEKENIMYVLVAINTEQMPILIQANSLESLNEKINDDYGDWQEFSDYCNNETGYYPEDLFSLWKLENGALVQYPFVIHTRPTIVL